MLGSSQGDALPVFTAHIFTLFTRYPTATAVQPLLPQDDSPVLHAPSKIWSLLRQRAQQSLHLKLGAAGALPAQLRVTAALPLAL